MEKRVLVLVNNVDSYILRANSTVREMVKFVKGVDESDMSSLEGVYFRIIDIERGKEIGCFVLEEFYGDFSRSLDSTLEELFDELDTTTISSQI